MSDTNTSQSTSSTSKCFKHNRALVDAALTVQDIINVRDRIYELGYAPTATRITKEQHEDIRLQEEEE